MVRGEERTTITHEEPARLRRAPAKEPPAVLQAITARKDSYARHMQRKGRCALSMYVSICIISSVIKEQEKVQLKGN